MKLFPDEAIDEDTYGKYEIEKEIGKGRMGIVYLGDYTEKFENESFTGKIALKNHQPRTKIRLEKHQKTSA